MKTFLAFICILSCSMVLTYIAGSYLADTPNLLSWTKTGQDYFIAVSIAITLFSTLYMIDVKAAAHIKAQNITMTCENEQEEILTQEAFEKA